MNTNPFDQPLSRFTTTVPLYIQIAQGLLDQIESGELSPGDRLPSERELSEALGVSRMTLLRALQLLETQGLLIRRRGLGTHVASPKIERQADQLVPFHRGMKRRGYVPGARVITFEKRRAEAAVARELGLPVSAPVYFVRRLQLLNQEPMLLERLTVSAHRFPKLESFDLSRRAVYEVMETEYDMGVAKTCGSDDFSRSKRLKSLLPSTDFGRTHMILESSGRDRTWSQLWPRNTRLNGWG